MHGVWDDDAVRGDLDRKWARGGFEVVGARGRPVGAIWTTDEDGAGGAPWSRLRELVLDPAEQRRGIGTALVRDEIARARRRGRGLRLRVLWASDARRLYARLGFVERERVGEKVWMELEPSADRG